MIARTQIYLTSLVTGTFHCPLHFEKAPQIHMTRAYLYFLKHYNPHVYAYIFKAGGLFLLLVLQIQCSVRLLKQPKGKTI